MKSLLLSLLALVFGNSNAMANDNKCLAKAELQARFFSAKENHISISSVQIVESFFHSEETGVPNYGSVLYYGVLTNGGEEINVGLTKDNCRLVEINYVTGDDE